MQATTISRPLVLPLIVIGALAASAVACTAPTEPTGAASTEQPIIRAHAGPPVCRAVTQCNSPLAGTYRVASCATAREVDKDPSGVCPEWSIVAETRVIDGTLVLGKNGSFSQDVRTTITLTSQAPMSCLAAITDIPTATCASLGDTIAFAGHSAATATPTTCIQTGTTCRCTASNTVASWKANGTFTLASGRRITLSEGALFDRGTVCADGDYAYILGQSISTAETGITCATNADCPADAGACETTPNGRQCVVRAYSNVDYALERVPAATTK